MKQGNSLLKGLLLGALTGVCFGLGGFFLARIPATAGMGYVMFLLVPFAAGFAVVLVTRHPSTVWAAILLAMFVSLAILIATGREGVLCALLALPWLVVGLTIGVLLGYLFRRYILKRFRHQTIVTGMVLLITPGLILAGHRAEQPGLDSTRLETVSSTIRVQAEPEEVWSNIQSVDSIQGAKPWLMYFGLPVPIRCTLERTGVGGKRICYFEHGFIEETVTQWAPPYFMQLIIDRTNMPGRHWLGFETASYRLRREGNSTVLTRSTTISSHLYPVWYWQHFERLGVASEHKYILHDLEHRVMRGSDARQ